MFSHHPGFIENIRSFIRVVENSQLIEEDHARLIPVLPVLLQAYSDILSSKGKNESQQRRGVDTVLKLVFESQGYDVQYVHMQSS
jgi:hypothetical protein